MLDYLKGRAGPALKLFIATTPLLFTMYLLYSLEKYQYWVPETMHRDKITIALVLMGMVLSFLVMSHFNKRAKL